MRALGPVIDELALVQALKENRIAGAGLDVYENEPRPHPELLSMNNVVCSPHTGSAVRELREAMANVVVENILAILDGRQPSNCSRWATRNTRWNRSARQDACAGVVYARRCVA